MGPLTLICRSAVWNSEAESPTAALKVHYALEYLYLRVNHVFVQPVTDLEQFIRKHQLFIWHIWKYIFSLLYFENIPL